jgi:hypothetical protein
MTRQKAKLKKTLPSMSRILNYLPGPELLWFIFYVGLIVIITLTKSPSKSMDSFYEAMAYSVPFFLVPLTFALYYIPFIGKDFLLLRIWISCIFGGHYLVGKGMSTYTEQGPGIGTAYIMGMSFILVVLIVLSVVRILVKVF